MEASLMAMLVGVGLTLVTLVVQGAAAGLAVEAVSELLAKRVPDGRVGARLHGGRPHEAVSGTLAFGWSTAAIVTVVIRLTRRRLRTRSTPERRGDP